MKHFLGTDGMPHHETARSFYFDDGKLACKMWGNTEVIEPVQTVVELQDMAKRIREHDCDGHGEAYPSGIERTAEKIIDKFSITQEQIEEHRKLNSLLP